jgi:hypothetical protein
MKKKLMLLEDSNSTLCPAADLEDFDTLSGIHSLRFGPPNRFAEEDIESSEIDSEEYPSQWIKGSGKKLQTTSAPAKETQPTNKKVKRNISAYNMFIKERVALFKPALERRRLLARKDEQQREDASDLSRMEIFKLLGKEKLHHSSRKR